MHGRARPDRGSPRVKFSALRIARSVVTSSSAEAKAACAAHKRVSTLRRPPSIITLMTKAIRAPGPMTVEEFTDWAMARLEGRYELVDGAGGGLAGPARRHRSEEAAL
jgi:hypothetical protein